jgi:sRNA-binding carbon storage regulator CsrA
MLMLKNPEATEKKLVLGDYMTVHMSGLKTSRVYNTKPGDMQVHREELLKQIQKQRGELVQRAQKPAGDLIDVRLRVAGADKIGWEDYSEIMNEDDKDVA